MRDADDTHDSRFSRSGRRARSGTDGNRVLRLASGDGDRDLHTPVVGMDIPREPRGPGRKLFAFAAVLLLASMITLLLRRIQPALPAVDRDLLVTAVVQRGPLPIEIRGWGELATDQVQAVDATVAGRVASVHVRAGDVVRAGSPLIGLASPDLALQTAKAEQEFTAAKAAFSSLRRSIGTQRLERESVLLERREDLARAGRSLERIESLFARGDASQEDLRAATDAVAALEEQVRIEEELLALLKETGDEQVSLEKEKLLALAEVLHREQERLSALAVTSPADALVDAVEVGAGDWVEPGTRLVRLVRPERMRAIVKVPAVAATRVRVGDDVVVVDAVGDSTGGEVQVVGKPRPDEEGRYVRLSVRLEDAPKADAAADAGVDAVIHLGLIEDALYVKRPAWAGEDGISSVFRLLPDGASAERVEVKFGTGSWDQVQVLEGLEQGDVIIVSDMSAFDASDRVRID